MTNPTTTPINVQSVEPLCVRLKRAAQLLSMSDRSFWSLVKAGTIPCVRIGKMRLFVVETLRKRLAELEAAQNGKTVEGGDNGTS
jgi:hypothetical protein